MVFMSAYQQVENIGTVEGDTFDLDYYFNEIYDDGDSKDILDALQELKIADLESPTAAMALLQLRKTLREADRHALAMAKTKPEEWGNFSWDEFEDYRSGLVRDARDALVELRKSLRTASER